MSTATDNTALLGEAAATETRLLESILQGFGPQAVQRVIEHGVDKQALYGVLGARTTINRRMKAGQSLTMEESDRLARVVAVIALAEDVFDNKAKALKWLQRASTRLPGQGSPLSLLATSYGADLVKGRLEQIRHGIYA